MQKKERFQHIVDYFSKHQPVAETELHYGSPYELLVAVILSAQCTDKRVNMVTPALFKAFPTPEVLAEASSDEVFQYIRSISYPNNKAKHLVGMAQMLIHDFKGEVPSDIDQLQKLPGVGRKNSQCNYIGSVRPTGYGCRYTCIQGFGAPGTYHQCKNPTGYCKSSWYSISLKIRSREFGPPLALSLHGRYICVARAPKCNECPLTAPGASILRNKLKNRQKQYFPLNKYSIRLRSSIAFERLF